MSTAKQIIESIKADLKDSPQPKATLAYMQLIKVFPLQSITSKAQHEFSLQILERLISHIDLKIESDEGVLLYFKTLSELIGGYERTHYKGEAVSGVDMLVYLMKMQGLTQADLAKELGGQSVVSKIIAGEREMNVRQIKALAKRFKVSPSVFI